jgi:hypothetical protein
MLLNKIKIIAYICLIKEDNTVNVVQYQMGSYIEVTITMLRCTEVHVHSRPWINGH